MRKMKLGALQVDSFETTSSAPLSDGTVQGFEMAVTTVPCPSFNPCMGSWNPTGCT